MVDMVDMGHTMDLVGMVDTIAVEKAHFMHVAETLHDLITAKATEFVKLCGRRFKTMRN